MLCCSKIAEAEAVVSVNEKEWLVVYAVLAFSSTVGAVCSEAASRGRLDGCHWVACRGVLL